jgi:hypothetical protein
VEGAIGRARGLGGEGVTLWHNHVTNDPSQLLPSPTPSSALHLPYMHVSHAGVPRGRDQPHPMGKEGGGGGSPCVSTTGWFWGVAALCRSPAIRGPTTVVPDRRTAQRPPVHEHHGRRTVALAEEARTTATSRAAATTRAGRMASQGGLFFVEGPPTNPQRSTANHCQSVQITHIAITSG